MKTRQGFVSNSSSSSFIVAFDKPIEKYSDEELSLALFGMKKDKVYCYEVSLDVSDLLKTIRESAKKNELPESGYFYYDPIDSEYDDTPFSIGDIYNEIEKDLLKKRGMKNYGEFFKEGMKEKREAFDEEFQSILISIAKEFHGQFVERNKERFLYFFEFSDNDGPKYNYLEHGGIFKHFDHLYQNMH